MTECLQELKEIISKHLGHSPEDIDLDSNLMNDLQADSLDTIEIVMFVEEKFEIEIDDHQIDTITTVRDLFQIVCDDLGGG